MARGLIYDCRDYAYSRLVDTVIRDGRGLPFRVRDVEEVDDDELEVYGWSLLDESALQESLIDCDLTPVPLGFANTKRGCAYLARVPRRNDYRQGLRRYNYTSLIGPDNRYVSDQDLYRCIMGHSLSIVDAMDESYNLGKEIAFHRDFSVKPFQGLNFDLQYKWRGTVGTVVNGLPALNAGNEYLQESLDEAWTD